MLRRLPLILSRPPSLLPGRVGGTLLRVAAAGSPLEIPPPLRGPTNLRNWRPLATFTPEPGAREALLKAAFEANRPTNEVGGVEGAYDQDEAMAAFIESQKAAGGGDAGGSVARDDTAFPDGAGAEVEGAYPAHHSLEAFIKAQMRPDVELDEEEARDDTAFPEGAGEPAEGGPNSTHHSLEAYIKSQVEGWEGAEGEAGAVEGGGGGREQAFADGVALVEELEGAGHLTGDEAEALVRLCVRMDPGMLVVLLACRGGGGSGRAAERMRRLLRMRD